MKNKKSLRRKTSIATIALLVLASMAALPGFAPTASAEEIACFDSGNEEALIYVRVCASFANPTDVPVIADVQIKPEWEEDDFCVISDLCAPQPKNVHNWVTPVFDEITVGTAEVSEHDVRVNSEQLEQLVCGALPPICKDIMDLVTAALTDFTVQVASVDGESVTGVMVTGSDGTNLYIGF